MKILNITEIIDKKVTELPGNAELQIQLGLISPEEEPFKWFHEIIWNPFNSRENIYELASLVAEIEISRTGDDDIETKSLLSEIAAILRRRILVRQMVAKEYAIEEIPTELLKTYALSADQGWKNRINEIARDLISKETRRASEIEQLSKLASHTAP